jgi:hypothetical protein
VTHALASSLVVQHIERYVSASILSSDLLLLEDEREREREREIY